MKTRLLNLCWLLLISLIANAQTGNVGVGTTNPQAKLHVEGDFRLLNGVPINKFSTDSLFTSNSHSVVPTEKAIKDYIQKGKWIPGNTDTIGQQAPLARGTTVALGQGLNAVHVNGNYAYVTSRVNGFTAYNISNPDSLKYLSSTIDNMDMPVDVFAQGNYVYVVCEGNDRLCIFDATNPANLVPKAFTSANMRVPTALYVQGNYAYVVSDLSRNLAIFDISDPNNIVAKGSILTNLGLTTDVFVQGSYAYVTSSSNNRLCIFDISNPNVIVAKAFTTTYLSGPESVAIKGDYAFVASRTNNRVCVFNISNPDAISPIGFTFGIFANPTSISITGNIAFVNSPSQNSISIFDISNPASLILKGSSTTNLDYPADIFAIGGYAYVASYNNNRLCVFDLDKSSGMVSTGAGIQISPTQWQLSGTNIYRSNGNVGIGNSSPAQRLQVSGNTVVDGNLGLGMSQPVIPLTFASSVGNKILLYGDGYVEHYGMGIQSALMQLYTDAPSANIAFGSGHSNFFNERARFINSGANGMQLNGRMILRNGTADINNGPGIWLNNPTNSALMGLIGTQNSTNIGFYSGATQWGFIYNTSNGRVGINNNNPNAQLAFSPSLEKKITLYPGGTGDVGMSVAGNDFRLYSDNINARVSFGYDDFGGGFVHRAYVPASGTVAMVVLGSLDANGVIYNSDARYKKNIYTINQSLDKVLRLRGVEYEMRKEEFPAMQFTEGTQIGLIAQEVEKIIPEVVSTNTDGYKSVDYAKLVPLLIEALKEQQQQRKEDQQRIERLEKLVETLLKK